MQTARAENANRALGYELFHWRTTDGREVDLVLYGERGLHAFEVTRSPVLRESDLAGLKLFCDDHAAARVRESALKGYRTLINSLPDRLKSLERENDELRGQLKTLRKTGLLGAFNNGVRWVGNKPFVVSLPLDRFESEA